MQVDFTPTQFISDNSELTRAGHLAMLCLSGSWQEAERQTLGLAAQLRSTGRVITLIVRAGSQLHLEAQAQALPCLPLAAGGMGAAVWEAAHLRAWLRQHQISLLLTTRIADLGLACIVRRSLPRTLRLLHRQFEPALPAAAGPLSRMTLRWQLGIVDAWLAPLPQPPHSTLLQTGLDSRCLWVVPPALLPHPNFFTSCSATEARILLDLPLLTPLIGVLDRGGNGPLLALEALQQVYQQGGGRAELVIMAGPDTPPEAERWARLRQRAQDLHITHRVHLRPLHTAQTAPSLFHSALDVLLLPAEEDAALYPLLQAMISGCPLVCARTAIADNMLQHGRTACLFMPGKVTDCARMLRATLENPVFSGALAQRATAIAHQQYAASQQRWQVSCILEYLHQSETAC